MESLDTGPRLQVHASKEVILSAGVIGSPHILLNSGIGNSTVLSQVGVAPLVNLPSVGRNLSDQPGLFSSFLVNSTRTFDDILQGRNATLFNEVYTEFNKTGLGPFNNIGLNELLFFRVNESVTQEFGDPASGKHSPHLEMYPANGLSGVAPSGHYLSIGFAVVSPASRGFLTINSSDPFAFPIIDPGYLTSPFDIAAMRQALLSMFHYLSARAWDGYVISQFGSAFANISATSDSDVLDEYIRSVTGPTEHLVGTAAMSARGADYGVLDPDLKVKGVDGLRVIDSSIFPFVTSAHTQVPTYIVAERGAALIKATWE
jgi:choline dehydrogenase-like flavoprotein